MVLEPVNDCVDKIFLLFSHLITRIPNPCTVVIEKEIDDNTVFVHLCKPYFPLFEYLRVDTFANVVVNKWIVCFIAVAAV